MRRDDCDLDDLDFKLSGRVRVFYPGSSNISINSIHFLLCAINPNNYHNNPSASQINVKDCILSGRVRTLFLSWDVRTLRQDVRDHLA